MTHVSTGEQIAFWILGPLAVLGALTNPGTSVGAERAPWTEADTHDAADPQRHGGRPETAGTSRRADAGDQPKEVVR